MRLRTQQPSGKASLSLWQLAPARLRHFNQRFDADQPSLVVLEPGGRFLPSRHEGVDPLAQEYDVLAVLDHLGDETHAVARAAKNSTIPCAPPGCAFKPPFVSPTT